jgi:hypothetical protein
MPFVIEHKAPSDWPQDSSSTVDLSKAEATGKLRFSSQREPLFREFLYDLIPPSRIKAAVVDEIGLH